jgi:predicted pyridoxine 5'-phosphate oxidase superfamily flavin-nucleotide-binding protein
VSSTASIDGSASVTRSPITDAPGDELFHEGELTVQRRAGVADVARRVGEGSIEHELAPEVTAFLTHQLFLVCATRTPDSAVWASLLVGPPGFTRGVDAQHLLLATRPAAGDPLAVALAHGPAPLGILALEAATRTRVRVNGTATQTEGGIAVEVHEAFGNCTKYIGARVPVELLAEGMVDSTRRSSDRLDAEQTEIVRRADTAFVASVHDGRGADASHRGGRPGFLEVGSDGRRVLLPDYSGNRMFQTLGNLTVDPRIGVLIVDWETGRTLQLAGIAELLWDGPEVQRRPKADRVIAIDVQTVADQVRALPIRFELREAYPLAPPLPGGTP